MLIIAGGVLIISGVIVLVVLKDEKDKELEEGDLYNSVFDVDNKKNKIKFIK